jgi:glycine dehydrogenase subunit 1
MPYIPHTKDEVHDMLAAVGKKSIDELFADIPEKIRLKALDLPEGKSELETRNEMRRLAARNANMDNYACFLGGGSYRHYIPAVIGELAGRSEFYTAYTPYQPEISQGVLQAIFEFQTMTAEIYGMDVSNASLYDGATALCEAALMSVRITRNRKEMLVDTSVSPLMRETLHTYGKKFGWTIVEVPHDNGKVNVAGLKSKISKNTASVIIQNPNYFGTIGDFTELATAAHAEKSTLIISANPMSMGLLKTPAAMGADIAVSEGQPLGNPLNYGGPGLGLMAAKKEHVRNMPGRIVGETVDVDGKRGFVLTLQAREQHIRREKATSNICSNQALNALIANIYLTTLGKNGFQHVALLNAQNAAYAKETLAKRGVKIKWSHPTFNEFVVELSKDAGEVAKSLLEKKVLAGIPLGKEYPELKNCLLVAVTECNTKEEIDRLAELLGGKL